MAVRTIIYKANINITDLSRQQYLSSRLTFTKHPSEKVERMMLRLIAWLMFADNNLEFTKGLCVKDEPELWVKDANNDIKLWIAIGLPNEKMLKKACNRAERVVLFTHHDKAAHIWKKQTLHKLHSLHNLVVVNIVDEVLSAAALMLQNNMDVQATIEDGQIWLNIDGKMLAIEPQTWKIDSF